MRQTKIQEVRESSIAAERERHGVCVCALIVLVRLADTFLPPSSASMISSPGVKTEAEAVAVEGDGDGGDNDDDEETDDTITRLKIDKGKAVMRGPPPEDEEQCDYFLGPLNSNPPVLSATLNKRGSGWWSDLPLTNPRHASLQLLPSQQTANIHRQSLPVEAYRVASSGSA